MLDTNEAFENEISKYVIELIESKVVENCFREFESENIIKDSTQTNSKIPSNDVLNDNIDQQPEHLYYELKIISKSLNAIEKSELSKSFNAFQTYYTKNHLTNFLKVLYQKEVQHMKLKVSNDLISQFSVTNKRQELINLILDNEIKSIFTSLNESLKNINQFISIFESKYKELSISLLINEKKKEKLCQDKLYSRQFKIYEEFKKDLGKSPKKSDYIQSFIAYSLVIQLKDNMYLPLPFENWSVSLYLQMFQSLLKSKVADKLTVLEEISSLILGEKEIDFSVAEKIAYLFNILDK